MSIVVGFIIVIFLWNSIFCILFLTVRGWLGLSAGFGGGCSDL